MASQRLRTGFSTGTAAAAGAKAALELLLTGKAPDRVQVSLPIGGRISIPVKEAFIISDHEALARVIKDGGDDPDATHKAEISTQVAITAGKDGERTVRFAAGPGVGKVTRPGLPLEVGEPAINPTPRQMIEKALRQAWATAGKGAKGFQADVVVSVKGGAKLARKTLNPRLGILDGISILGTTGLVKPYSHEAYTATITSGLSVALAMGLTEVVLTTGGKSEKLAMKMRPDLEEPAFIQIADFFGFALEQVKENGFSRVGLVSFFGKSVKQAQRLAYTHAHKSPMELKPLADWIRQAGADPEMAREVEQANTARHVLNILREGDALHLVEEVGRRLEASCRSFLDDRVVSWVRIVDFDGTVLYPAK